MPTSDARIQANRQNALLSTGPRTEEGKAQSRVNSLKHGMTGAGIVVAEVDAAEILRRSASYVRELNAVGDIQINLAHRAAVNSVRMERGADQENAALTDRVRQAQADFVPPEDATTEEADQLRAEVGRRAMFDPSAEATLARRHEAAAERGFFRALKELRQVQAQASTEVQAQPQPQAVIPPQAPTEAEMALMASILELKAQTERIDATYAQVMAETPPQPFPTSTKNPKFAPSLVTNELSFSVGRSR